MSRPNSEFSLANSADPRDWRELRNVVGSLTQWSLQEAPANAGGPIITTGPIYVTHNSLLVYKPIQNNTRSSGFLGYNTMSSNGRHDEARTFPSLPNGNDNDSSKREHTPRSPSRDATPEFFLNQPLDWFQPGRFFRMWAREDLEIHDRQFILLDSKNIEGKGVRVDTLDHAGLKQLAERSAASRTIMSLKCRRAHDGSHKAASGPGASYAAAAAGAPQRYQQSQDHARLQNEDKEYAELLRRVEQKNLAAVYLEEHHDSHQRDSYIQLEHTYNIPFKHEYKYIDLGMLEPECLDELRTYYIEYLTRSWRVTDAVLKKLGGRK